jgi:hypothetical protein
MEGFSFVTPVTGLNGPNTGKEDDDEIILSGLMVIMLATGPKVHEFKPGQGQWIFKGDNL